MSMLHNIAASLPEFTDDPKQRLRHTVAAHAETDPASWAVTATAGGVYPRHERTGLTYGDLGSLLAQMDQYGPEARERLARHLFAADGADPTAWDQRHLALKQVRSGPNGDWLARGMEENYARIYARADELLAVIAGKES